MTWRRLLAGLGSGRISRPLAALGAKFKGGGLLSTTDFLRLRKNDDAFFATTGCAGSWRGCIGVGALSDLGVGNLDCSGVDCSEEALDDPNTRLKKPCFSLAGVVSAKGNIGGF